MSMYLMQRYKEAVVRGLDARGVVINGTHGEGRTARDVEEGERCAAPVKITGVAARYHSELMV